MTSGKNVDDLINVNDIFIYSSAVNENTLQKNKFLKVGFSTMAFTAKILSWRFRHLNIVGLSLIHI